MAFFQAGGNASSSVDPNSQSDATNPHNDKLRALIETATVSHLLLKQKDMCLLNKKNMTEAIITNASRQQKTKKNRP